MTIINHISLAHDTRELVVIKQDITATVYFLMIKIAQIESQLLITFLARLMPLTEIPTIYS